MSIPPILNTRFFGPISTILEEIAGKTVVDRAWSSIGLSRELMEEEQVFVPYQLQSDFGENVARRTGERYIGALVGRKLKYTDLSIYANYVLEAPRLLAAFDRGARALRFVAPVSRVHVTEDIEYVRLQYATGLESRSIGTRHVHEAIPFLLIDLARHFLGCDWQPAWVELDSERHIGDGRLEELYNCKVILDADLPAIAFTKDKLLAPNPKVRTAQGATVYGDLRELVRLRPPRKMTDLVCEILKLQIKAGDVSEDAVAHRLNLGRRTIQRRLKTEGASYREIQQQFTLQRACQLLAETEFSVAQIAHALCYSEPNSFRRAFLQWTGLSPPEFRRKVSANRLLL